MLLFMISFMHRKCTGRVISLKTPSMYVKFLAAIRLRSTAQVFLAFLAFALYNASQRLEFEKVFLGNWTAMCFTRLEVLHQSSIHSLFDLHFLLSGELFGIFIFLSRFGFHRITAVYWGSLSLDFLSCSRYTINLVKCTTHHPNL